MLFVALPSHRPLKPCCLLLALLALLATSTCLQAANNDSPFEEIVVTGTRTEESYSKSPVKIDLVNKDSLEKQHAMDLSEGLKTLPNVMLKPIRGKEGTEAWIQGISADRVVVVIDGEPVSKSTGSVVDLSQVSVTDISHIEVVKGATSVLYGSEAMGGVINIITRPPKEGFHVRLAADGGSYGQQNPSGDARDISRQRANANMSFANDFFYIQGDISARYSDGFQADPQAWSQQGPDGHKINTAINLGITPTINSEYSIRHEAYDQEQHTRYLTPIGNTTVGLNKQDDASRARTSIKGRWYYANGDVTARAFTEDYKNSSAPGNFTREFEVPSSKASLQWSHSFVENNTLTSGMSFFKESLTEIKIEDTGIVVDELGGEKSRDNIDIYIQDDWAIGRLRLLPGLRWQNDSDFSDKTTAKINARVDVNDVFFIRAGFGQGYRVPNLKERWFVFDHSQLGYKILGNPNLEPESVNSYQLGFVWSNEESYEMEINFFRNDLDNLIEELYSYNESPTVIVYQYQNINSALTEGMEISGSLFALSGFKFQGGYTYLHAIDTKTDERLKDRPKHQIKSLISYDTASALNISLIATWQSDEIDVILNQTSPAWTQWDAKFTQGLGNYLSIYGGIDNITNQQKIFDASYDNRPVIGRVAYLGFKINY